MNDNVPAPESDLLDEFTRRAEQRIAATLHLSPRGQVPEFVHRLSVDLLAAIWHATAPLGVDDDVWRYSAANLASSCLDAATILHDRRRRETDVAAMINLGGNDR